MKPKNKTSGGTRSAAQAPSGPVTIEMVAQMAGVSLSTVSRILNGTATVSETKTRAVDAAIAELGFVPNPVARGLAGAPMERRAVARRPLRGRRRTGGISARLARRPARLGLRLLDEPHGLGGHDVPLRDL